jgi:ABC-type glycerol-3-phosphate transport system substrate-binding protein
MVLLHFASCSYKHSAAVLWTDRPEFVFYAEKFNAAEEHYKVEARFFESPAQKLAESAEYPDIVASGWLRNVSAKSQFRPLDKVFKKGAVSRDVFYSRLLDMGNIDGRQYLLPVAFNIPALVFSRNYAHPPQDPFTISLEEIIAMGKVFNVENGGVYSRMGFSPLWSDDFLITAVELFNANFREASPVTWDPAALEQAMLWAKNWIAGANTSIHAEEDFAFKYLYNPPEKLIASGSILFAFMDSAGFFTLPEEQRSGLDFRWIAQNEIIPLNELDVYLGIHKKAKAVKAAEAFTLWFFNTDTQRRLLEASRSKRLTETSFGIGGGFSAMRAVTEQVFPRFYYSLLGHNPPESFLSPPNILPRNWAVIKKRVILPYLHERIRSSSEDEIRSLEQRMNEWYRQNRQ